ncbi:Polygalacturonase 1 beta-like protein 3 [Camellia lanceoleosa]|uniref:Polygalacturonase 1 beta-like protein 3 n=1 Tax=Camellia lanceoleosa TaxID=1840588 RepID=A0ACC0G2E6_9ERIC|nr:Polygalacturonase 1 beta-like protein 3 [Camellia lanceoleosa]
MATIYMCVNYGSNGNVPKNNFKNYGDGGNAAIDEFMNYREKSNVGDDSFQSYEKNSNSGTVKFKSYGQSFNEGTDKFVWKRRVELENWVQNLRSQQYIHRLCQEKWSCLLDISIRALLDHQWRIVPNSQMDRWSWVNFLGVWKRKLKWVKVCGMRV